MKKTIALLLVATMWMAGCSSRTEEPEVIVDTTDTNLDIGAALEAPLESVGQVLLASNPPALATGSDSVAIITASVTDAGRRAIEGHEVVFSSDGGALQNII